MELHQFLKYPHRHGDREYIFYSRHDPDDPRLGDLARTWESPLQLEELLELAAATAIIGIPDDTGVALNGGRVGAAKGPQAIRRALYRLTPGSRERERWPVQVDLGDIIIAEGDRAEAIAHTHQQVQTILELVAAKGLRPLVLGGGHDLTYPALAGTLKGLARRRAEGGKITDGGTAPDPVSCGLIYLDAHLDVRDPAKGINSGTPFRRLLEDSALDLPGRRVAALGIQPLKNSRAHLTWLRNQGALVVLQNDLGRTLSPEAQLSAAIERVAADADVLAFSLDLDGTGVPGVSAPSPTGLARELYLQAALLAGAHPKTVYLDIMECAPPHDDPSQTTCRLAAEIAAHFLLGRALGDNMI